MLDRWSTSRFAAHTEKGWREILGFVHPIWPWISEHAAFLSRFEVGKTACERMKGISAKVNGIMVTEQILWKRRRAGGACARAACTLASRQPPERSREFIVGDQRGIWLTRTVYINYENRDNLSIVSVPWRKNDDDPKIVGERIQGDVVVMDKDLRENLERRSTLRRRRVCASRTREDLVQWDCTARSPFTVEQCSFFSRVCDTRIQCRISLKVKTLLRRTAPSTRRSLT